jgi:butyryl-CoA dehydrogenase
MIDQQQAAPERCQDRLYHDDPLVPAEVARVRADARTVCERDLAPLAHAIACGDEVEDGFPWEAFRALAAGGLFRVPFAAPHGLGLEHPAVATTVVTEEIAYHSNSMAGVYDGQCILSGQMVAAASPAVRDRWLPPLISGEAVASFATTEPDASSDLRPEAISTRAERIGGGRLRITGRKRFITNSVAADVVVVLVRSDEHELSMVLVPLKESSRVRVGRADRKMGNRGQVTADIHFDGVEVPEDHVIGQLGGGLQLALRTLVYGRLGVAAAGVGMAQAALDHAVAHLRSRRLFGRRLGEFQHWQFRMAEHATHIENARNLYLKAATRLDRGITFPEPEAAMAKWYATSMSVDVARDALQVFGGYGFTRELAEGERVYPLEAIYRDTKIGEIYEGANEIQKWVIARALLGRDLTG